MATNLLAVHIKWLYKYNMDVDECTLYAIRHPPDDSNNKITWPI